MLASVQNKDLSDQSRTISSLLNEPLRKTTLTRSSKLVKTTKMVWHPHMNVGIHANNYTEKTTYVYEEKRETVQELPPPPPQSVAYPPPPPTVIHAPPPPPQ